MKTKTLVIVGVVLLLVAGVGAFALRPVAFDSSWVVVANLADEYDNYTAELLRSQYGCGVWDIAESHDYNALGQSLIIMGGSDELSELAPWIRSLTIIAPETQPDVRFEFVDDATPSWWLISPIMPRELDTGANNFGLITVAYDLVRMRSVVVVMGYDHWCTQAGVRLLSVATMEHGYTIYRCVEHPSDDFEADAPWSYEIVEQG